MDLSGLRASWWKWDGREMGLLGLTNLSTALLLLPLCPLGVYLGIWLQRRVPEALFYRIITAALLVSGVKLFWDGFFG